VVSGYPPQKASEKKLGTQMSDLVGREDMLTADLPGGWEAGGFGAAVMHEAKFCFSTEPTSASIRTTTILALD